MVELVNEALVQDSKLITVQNNPQPAASSSFHHGSFYLPLEACAKKLINTGMQLINA